MWWWIISIAVLGIVVASREALAKTVEQLTYSATALAEGIDNTPKDEDTRRRLEYTAGVALAVLAVVRQRFPGASLTSGLRVEELNEKLAELGYAAVPGSYHTYGLAFDISGIDDVAAAAQWIRQNASRLPVQPRSVLAEIYKAHVHVDLFDPLGKLEAPRATYYALRNPPGSSPEYGALA